MPSDLFVEVVKIESIIPHGNADKLEIAVVKGWQCIVPKDRYQKGDKVIYIPIDSMIPYEMSEELGITRYLSNPKKNNDGKVISSRVRTTKLRGIISQGVIIDLPDQSWKVGKDVKEELNITKYKPIRNRGGYGGGAFGKNGKLPYWQLRTIPGFDKYTHIQHFKNFPDVIQEGEEVVITEKIHGTNFRSARLEVPINFFPFKEKIILYMKKFLSKISSYEFSNLRFLVGSHNCNLRNVNREQNNNYATMNVYWRMALAEKLEKKLKTNEEIFGEIYGKGVQKLLYDSPNGTKVKYFDMKIKVEDGFMKYLDWDDFVGRCQEENLPIVPVLYRGPFKKEILAKLAEGNSTFADNIREGAVVKTVKERIDERLGRVILKYINDEYLLIKNKLDDALAEGGEEAEFDIFDH